MQEISINWLLVLGALAVGFLLGRMTVRDPIQRDRERKAYDAELRRHKARLEPATIAAVEALLRENKRIEAIKRVRADLGIDLRQAKDLVETWPGQAR